jgi:hypothetical protein
MNNISSLPGSILRRWAMLLLPLLALLVSACTTYSHSPSYPSRGYSYQQRAAYYYPPNYVYYGSYQPGWFVSMGFGGGYYGGGFHGSWGYGSPFGSPAPYWPTYAVPYYQPRYRYAYSYYDPWYYSWAGYHPAYYGFGYGSPYWPGYRQGYGHGYYKPYGGGHYGGGNYGGRPYQGGTHTYRPPNYPQPDYQQPGRDQRPDPVVIPRDQRGRRSLDPGYREQRGNVAQRPYPQETRPAELRSTTVVTEQQGMTRSVSVAPGGRGEQGMVVSNRGEQKVRQSRMHPVGSPAVGAPATPAVERPPQGRQQTYQHTVDSSNANGRADGRTGGRGQGDSEREEDR